MLSDTFTATTNAVGGSVALSALVGIVPLAAFFFLLMGVKLKAHWSAIGAAVVALILAVLAYAMPLKLAALSLSQGIAFGLFPIVFIIWMAVWIYDLTVKSGRFEDLRTIFSRIGRGDMRVQAMLIAFCFGGLLEALAGFGAPVAIIAAMLLAIGMKPMKAVLTTLVANTAPVAFGAMAIPVTTAANLSELHPETLASMTGRQVSLIAIVVPFVLCLIMDGVRGLKQIWPMALVVGICFGGGQFLASNFFSYVLTDVVACLLSLVVGVVFLRVWAPHTPEDQASQVDTSGVQLSPERMVLALFPYVLIVVVFAFTSLWRIGVDIPASLKATDIKVPWPGLHGHLLNAAGKPVGNTIFTFSWLSNPGTILFICGVITLLVYTAKHDSGKFPMSIPHGFAELFSGLVRMRWSYVTIASVMGLAYVMNFSGQTASIGALLAATGGFFPFISPALGWLGTAVTGSATSANALFAQMQASAANQISASQYLMVGANTSGAVLGKMLSPQTAAIAAAATQMDNGEGEILGQSWKYSLGLLVFLGIVVYLQSTGVLGWMVVG
ncbi:L-lactate permease [Corynebacterium sp. 3HC-13]|uniref:L-lactate permease n=1 Tax=Corynebacterium poyangense TaxID=2684405 RepID=UPI001CD0105B|nr:L-lactate permease [Corynebacterium poyangense]MBZ8177059.1 L-lactate permease [Corynebacterium poyangense]